MTAEHGRRPRCSRSGFSSLTDSNESSTASKVAWVPVGFVAISSIGQVALRKIWDFKRTPIKSQRTSALHRVRFLGGQIFPTTCGRFQVNSASSSASRAIGSEFIIEVEYSNDVKRYVASPGRRIGLARRNRGISIGRE
jgi:hypothetical protein